MDKKRRKVILEDGSEYYGYGFGSSSDRMMEIVFNTSMVGYQEIISDPSYNNQAIVMTYPLIGNYGINDDDYESKRPVVGGMIVRRYVDEPSNFRVSGTLCELMKKYNIVGLEEVDTRKLTRQIRDVGSCKAFITDADFPKEEALKMFESWDYPHDGVMNVSSKEIWTSKVENARFHVVAIDCGMKLNIVRKLNKALCDVTVLPYDTDASQIEALHPDGVFISNGPGDPTDVLPVIETIKALKGKYPIFGICLGNQLIALAYGAKTFKLKFGHRGGNHPVMNLLTGKIEITSQNHSYAVDKESAKKAGLEITHINLLDNTVEGLRCKKDRIFAVQYHPESAPGPQDSGYLFKRFTYMMEGGADNA